MDTTHPDVTDSGEAVPETPDHPETPTSSEVESVTESADHSSVDGESVTDSVTGQASTPESVDHVLAVDAPLEPEPAGVAPAAAVAPAADVTPAADVADGGSTGGQNAVDQAAPTSGQPHEPEPTPAAFAAPAPPFSAPSFSAPPVSASVPMFSAPPPPVALNGPPSERLRQLGLVLPGVAPALADYLPAVRSGSLVYTSGQLPLVDGVLTTTGVVGDESVDVTVEHAYDLARTCAVNAIAAIAAIVDLDSVVRVVKVVCFVASAPGFTSQPAVANGASALLGQVFGEAGRHARSAVGVIALPLNASVEVEVVVEVAPDA